MDGMFISIWLLFLAGYVIVQARQLRYVDRTKNVTWQINVLKWFTFCTGGITFISLLILRYPLLIAGFGSMFMMCFVAVSIIIYLLSVYSYLESSVTVKLFSLIVSRDEKGISLKDLYAIHGVEEIVSRRIKRFIAIGEIEKKGKYFSLIKRVSAFSLKTMFHPLFCFFFP